MTRNLLAPPPFQGEAVPYEEQVSSARAALPEFLPADPREVLVALDVDGTLLTSQGASANVRRTVASAVEAGLNLVIATGRDLSATRPVLRDLNLGDGYSVSSNGAQTMRWERGPDGRHVHETIDEVFFDPREAATRILSVLPDLTIATDSGGERMRVNRYFPDGELLAGQDLMDLEDLLSRPTVRMVARAPWLEREEFSRVLGDLDLSMVECAVGWTSWADLTAWGTTKARGLDPLVAQLGVDPRGTVAIGDGTNDIAMLRWAAHGVAMGSATPDVVEAADAVTGPVDHDGAAAVLDALLERY